jgi:hypothetical protein
MVDWLRPSTKNNGVKEGIGFVVLKTGNNCSKKDPSGLQNLTDL